MKGTEMQTLKELQVEVKEDLVLGLVDEDRCLEIIGMGNMLKGYGLWLAKEVIHKDKKEGWLSFLDKAGVSKTIAYDNIEFYLAKSSALAEQLPTKEKVFRALKGKTVEAKSEQYVEVQEFTKSEAPTAKQVEIVAKTRDRVNTTSDTQAEIITTVLVQSSAVQDEYVKALGKRGVGKAVKMMENGADEADIIVELQGQKEKAKFTPTEKANMTKKTSTEIERLKAENAELKAEIKRMKEYGVEVTKKKPHHKPAYENWVYEIHNIVSLIRRTADRVTEAKAKNQATFEKMKPNVERALLLLKLPTTSRVTLEDAKRAFRDEAKTAHPDMGGDTELFNAIKQSYDVLKKALVSEKED